MTKSLLFPVLVSMLFASCSENLDSDNTPDEENIVDACTGSKCDGVSDKFKDFFDDMKKVSTDDLKIVGAGLASEELNNALEGLPYSSISLSPTSLYGKKEEVLGQVIIHDINLISAGLTTRLGENSFSSKITNLRRDEIQRKDIVYAESHFKIGPEVAPKWSFSHGDALGSVGFLANATIESVVIAPFTRRDKSLIDNPLTTMKNLRGFVLPRHMSDVKAMAPGESMTLRAQGVLGFNMGVGVPFHIASLGSTIALNARLSFAARVALEGKLDVQLVRGANNEAFIDVGLSNAKERHFEVALNTGWGVSGLPSATLDLGVTQIDVTEIAEKALAKQLKRIISAQAKFSKTKSESRLTVARFKIDLGRAGADAELAMAQALRGDIRFAQTLANSANAGITQELDISKDSRSEASYLGFHFLGMEFYRANNFNTGTVSISEGNKTQTLLFTELDQKSGLFFTDRNIAWRTLVSLKSKNGKLQNAEVNARITLRESDKFLTRDQMLDHVDPLLGFFTGFDPIFNGFGAATDALASVADNTCVEEDFDSNFDFEECLEGVSSRPEYQQNINVANQRFAQTALAGGFDPQFGDSKDFAEPLFDFKRVMSGINDRPDVALDGPTGRLLTQIRFSDRGVHEMMDVSRHGDFRKNLESILRLMALKRTSTKEAKKRHIDKYVRRRVSRLDEMGDVFSNATVDFANFDDITKVELFGSELGNHGQVVTVDNKRNVVLGSIAEHKAEVLEKLFPKLVKLAKAGIFDDLDEPAGFVVGYSLLWMSDPSSIELLTNIGFDEDENLDGVNVYGRGTSPLIDAGLFDIDLLLKAENEDAN